MPGQTHDQLARHARFVFHGTVQKATTRQVPGLPGATALTVRVDEIVQGPEKLSAYQGRDVFVVPRKGERFSDGGQAVFYTNGMAFGDTLTVESIGHLPVHAGAMGVRSVARPAAMLRKRDVEHRIASADMVVVGKVTAVRLPPSEAAPATATRATGAASPASRGRVTEHDPLWRDAVIDIERVAKGRTARRQVVVRFPASDDVRWFRAPKFQAGDEGVFILHKSDAAATGAMSPASAGRGTVARATAARGDEVFTALHPEDVQPPELQEEIGTIVKSAPARVAPTVARARAPHATKKASRRKTAATRRRSSR